MSGHLTLKLTKGHMLGTSERGLWDMTVRTVREPSGVEPREGEERQNVNITDGRVVTERNSRRNSNQKVPEGFRTTSGSQEQKYGCKYVCPL